MLNASAVSEQPGLHSPGVATVEQILPMLSEFNGFTTRLKQVSARDFSAEPLSISACNVLQTLYEHGPQSVPAIARWRGNTRQNIQIVINRLQGEGYVQWKSNPAHKKSALVALSEKGTAAVLRWCEAERKILEGLAGGISSSEAAAITTVLRRLRSALQERAPEGNGNPTEVLQTPRARATRSASNRSSREQGASEFFTQPQPTEPEFPVNLL